MPGRLCERSGETCRCGDGGRSQSLHSTDKKRLRKELILQNAWEAKPCLGKGGRKVDTGRTGRRKHEHLQCPKGLDRCRDARAELSLGRSGLLYELAVVGAGNGV
jgi:hypothetical protein